MNPPLPEPDDEDAYTERLASLRRLFILTALSAGTIALLCARGCAGV